MRNVAAWASPGPLYNKKLTASKELGKETLFDILQLKGEVRSVLNALFELNKDKVTKADRTEDITKKLYPIGLRSK